MKIHKGLFSHEPWRDSKDSKRIKILIEQKSKIERVYQYMKTKVCIEIPKWNPVRIDEHDENTRQGEVKSSRNLLNLSCNGEILSLEEKMVKNKSVERKKSKIKG